jgi:hypothetical protein
MIKAAVNVLAAEIDPDDEVCENGVPDATSDLRGQQEQWRGGGVANGAVGESVSYAYMHTTHLGKRQTYISFWAWGDWFRFSSLEGRFASRFLMLAFDGRFPLPFFVTRLGAMFESVEVRVRYAQRRCWCGRVCRYSASAIVVFGICGADWRPERMRLYAR